jgi:hypothetical protein
MLLILYSLLAFSLTGVRADGWDDFSNNLATDLAPLISLFGEQATKQYLSESISWLDYFILAMAPIGILTALVSAIRVCGSSGLRAFIGRAQEGEGVAESELCSSTSRNVCELYNNGGIARIFGRPKILEFVHDPNGLEGISSLDLFKCYVATQNGAMEWEAQNHLPTTFPSEEYSPNLSLNVGIRRPEQWVFVAVATLGFVLQGGVLAFAGSVTYLLHWDKDGEKPLAYACPLAIAGTILVCSGVFLCSALVGESTKEEIFKRNRDSKQRSSIYWLQPQQVVGDQMFESFCHADRGGKRSIRQYTSSWKDTEYRQEIAVWIAVIITISGFVLQFVGLRGVHSTISVAQLGAALLMTAARAGLRMQRLEMKDNEISRVRMVVGHELDWLALRLGEDAIKETLKADPTNEPRKFFWRFCGAEDDQKRIIPRMMYPSTNDNAGIQILACRRRLAQLTDLEPSKSGSAVPSRHFDTEMVVVREEAQKLVMAIELAVNNLFVLPLPEKFRNTLELYWGLMCCVSTTKTGFADVSEKQGFYLKLEREKSEKDHEGNRWRLKHKHDMEAMLGLWVWSLERDQAIMDFDTEQHQARRIISSGKYPDEIGLTNWLPYEVPTVQTAILSTKGQTSNPYLLWKFKDGRFDLRQRNDGVAPRDTVRLYGWHALESAKPKPQDSADFQEYQVSTVRANGSILSLCAQEIFGAFVQSFLDIAPEKREAKVNTDAYMFYLTDDLTSAFTNAFIEAGLGSREEAFLCVMPLIASKEFQEGRTPLWHAARCADEGFVEYLLDFASFSSSHPDNYNRTPLWQAASKGNLEIVEMFLDRDNVRTDISDSADVTALSEAAANGHEEVVQLLLERGVSNPNTRDKKGCTALWRAAANGHEGVVRLLLEEDVDAEAKDKLGATPLKKAIQGAHEMVVALLREHIQGSGSQAISSSTSGFRDDEG